MIALGSTHRGSLGRITPGSVAQRLLNGAPCPIAIAPAGLRERELAVAAIGVAFDGSHESRRALRAAVDLARAADAHVDLIGAVHVPHRRDRGAATRWPAAAERSRTACAPTSSSACARPCRASRRQTAAPPTSM